MRTKGVQREYMRNIAQTFAISIAVLILPLIVFGQTKSVTREEYYSAENAAESKTDKQLRRKISIWTSYENGRVDAITKSTFEFVPPDSSRWVDVATKGAKVETIEQITIGKAVYRRENGGQWSKRTKDSDGFGFGGGEILTGEYFIESERIGKEKLQVLREKIANYNNTFFDEKRTWINSKGLIVKTLSTTSRGQTLVSRNDVTYDYKAKPAKIVAPIK